MIIKYSLGVDIVSKTMECCLSSMDIGQAVPTIARRSFANTPAGFNGLDRWIRKHYRQEEGPLVVVLEATGVYYEACALYLTNQATGYRLSCLTNLKNICNRWACALKRIRSMLRD